MGSERLPGKVMKDILGKPMISYTLDRAATSKYIDEVVLATSDTDKEQPLVTYLKQNRYKVFCGDENNVLKRYVDAANQFGGDIIIRITGDCPLIDPMIIDNVVTYFLSNSYDFIRLDVPDSFVRGFDVEVFTREAMDRVYDITQKIEGDSPYKEHVTLYMYQHPEKFKVDVVKGSPLYQKGYRLCVDTKEDLQLITTIYMHFDDPFVSGARVIKFLDQNPQVAGINQTVIQKHV
jgi:spore coat polysaccharide biosynthesis protein SpsF